MTIEIDTIAKALYLRLAPGRVADTVELADAVLGDVDEAGAVLGIEFTQVDRFAPFVATHPDLVSLPSPLAYTSVDRGTSWRVIVSRGDQFSEAGRRGRVVELNGLFLADLVANPALVDQIKDGATITLDLAMTWN
jgi:uncharacterized protein YuzE